MVQIKSKEWTDTTDSWPFFVSVLAISEVEIKGGSAHATSSHPAPWTPEAAFILGHSNAWIAEDPSVPFPSTVWYEFPAQATFVPARVSFRPRQDCCQDEGPTVWQFVGSNDENCGKFGNWTVLCEDKSDTGYPTKAWTKYCDVDNKILKRFRCLGISGLNTRNKDGIMSLKDVRFWKKTYQWIIPTGHRANWSFLLFFAHCGNGAIFVHMLMILQYSRIFWLCF